MPNRTLGLVTGISPGVPLALLTLCVHCGVNLSGGYRYFRDEFYCLACSDHLAWGYVDHPPLSIVLLWLNRVVLGDSVFALRFLPAVAAAGLVFLTGMVAREFGGGRREEHEKVFRSVRVFAIHQHPYAMPFETDLPIFVCREPTIALKDIWDRVKRYI